MLRAIAAGLTFGVATLAGCGDDTHTPGVACPMLDAPLAEPGDAIDGDDYQSFARPFFDEYCVRCHESTRTTPAQRGNAPPDLDWDLEAAIRDNLPEIRHAVGVINYMPLTAPFPSCDDRARLVRWIDAEAP